MKMLDLPAFDTFCVEMLAAVAACPNILVDIAFPLLITEGSQSILTAKLSQLTIETASPTLGIAVENHTQFLNRKLTVGVLLEKANELPPSVCLIDFFHFSKPLNHLRIILKL